jgi:hypothetical protein
LTKIPSALVLAQPRIGEGCPDLITPNENQAPYSAPNGEQTPVHSVADRTGILAPVSVLGKTPQIADFDLSADGIDINDDEGGYSPFLVVHM